MNATLPTGQIGRLLAMGVTIVMLALVWFTVAAPLIDWHAERGERLERLRALAVRMDALVQDLPALRQAASGPSPQQAVDVAVAPTVIGLDGATDAIAAASLQQLLQDMATQAGASLSSEETLPATQAGAYRRIGVHVSVSAPWEVLIRLLQAVALASPRMLIDDLQFHGTHMVSPPSDPAMQAGLTVFAFRAGVVATGSQ